MVIISFSEGLCGAQSGAGDKKSSEVTLTKGDSKGDVTLTKALNNSKVFQEKCKLLKFLIYHLSDNHQINPQMITK